MKKISLIIFSLFLVGLSFSQAPASFKYQAVVRYQDGAIVQNQTVALRISILSESPVGNTVYIEAHNVATNEFGIANLNIGEGNPVDGNFTDIDWGSNTYFIKSELDLNNGSAYEFIGTSNCFLCLMRCMLQMP